MKIPFYKKEDREPWQIAAARFCVEKSEGGFSSTELKEHVGKNYSVSERQVEFFFQEEIQHPEGRQFNRDGELGKFVPPLSLVSKITDYDELKEARKNAKQAFWISMGSIIIALVTLIVTIYTK